jgi:hypothetical protein
MCRVTINGALNWILDLLPTLTQFVITLNSNAIAYLNTLQITRAYAKSFPVRGVFASSCLVTVPNNGYFSASGVKSS